MKTAIMIIVTLVLTVGAFEGIPKIATKMAESKQRKEQELAQNITGSWLKLKILWDTIDCDSRREGVMRAFLEDDEIEKPPLSPMARDYFVDSTDSMGSDRRISNMLVPFEMGFIKIKAK